MFIVELNFINGQKILLESEDVLIESFENDLEGILHSVGYRVKNGDIIAFGQDDFGGVVNYSYVTTASIRKKKA